jgi:glutaredoxin-like protein NrdH
MNHPTEELREIVRVNHYKFVFHRNVLYDRICTEKSPFLSCTAIRKEDDMNVNHVEGADKGELLIYTLSTCIWCKKTKAFLDSLGVGYDIVEVDALPSEEKEKTLTEMKHFNPQCSFPTLVVNNKQCIVGYNETKIREVLGV